MLAAFFGAVVAAVVGLPALRIRGLYLAVVTLAFALAAVQYFLNPTFFEWIPDQSMGERPALFGIWAIDSAEPFYYLCLAVTVVIAAGLVGIRRSRTGRVLIAMRENERGAAAYGVSVVRMKLSAFAISGALAAVGGALLVLLQRGYTTSLYVPFDNLLVFTAVVVGGLGSLVGGVIGAAFLKGGEWWLPSEWRLLVSGMGVLAVLLVLPGGIGGALFSVRDSLLRSVARRRGIVVPSLLADVRDPGDEAGEEIPVPTADPPVADEVGAIAGSAVDR
jgi:branched-chain amino acid transport system permease protein